MVGYLPIKLRLNPVKKMINIPIEQNNDDIYTNFEFQYLESFERGKGYRVLAMRKTGEVDVYEDDRLIHDKSEVFNSFFNRLGKQKVVEFENPKLEINDETLYVYIEFVDLKNRKIIIDIKDNVKKTNGIDLLDRKGYTIDQPDFLPLVFLYDMNYISKKCKYNFLIDYKKIKIAKNNSEYPKLSSSHLAARYSLVMQVIEFGIDDGMEMIDLGHELTTDGFKYCFKDEKLTEISINEGNIPFRVIFDAGLPQKMGSGKLVINTYRNMGKIVGAYNNIVNGKKIKGQIRFNKWNPNPVVKEYKNIINEFRIWPTYYELSRMLDLELLECTNKWVNNKDGHEDEIY